MKYCMSAAILAGGESRRMGGAIKPLINIRGRRIIDSIIETASGLFREILIVTNTPAEFATIAGVRIVPDIFVGAGPLGGLHAALSGSEYEAVFVFAGDMPFIDRPIVISEIELYNGEECEAVVPRVGGLAEPLHAIYSRTLIARIESLLAENRGASVRDLFASCKTCWIDLEKNDRTRVAFSNLNTPEDIRDLLPDGNK